jgi:ATP-binding cassette subfamily B protein
VQELAQRASAAAAHTTASHNSCTRLLPLARVRRSFGVLGLSKVCSVAAPAYLGVATDGLLRGDAGAAASAILLYGVLRFGVSAFEEAQRLVYLRVKETAYHEIACRTFAHLHGLSLSWHISKRTGVVLRAVDRGIASAATVVDMLFLKLVRACVHVGACAS